jgi:hypothetical protein
MTAAYRLHRNAAVGKRRYQRQASPVTRDQLDPDAHALALELADGDPRRLQILDAENVVVLNQPRRRMQ